MKEKEESWEPIWFARRKDQKGNTLICLIPGCDSPRSFSGFCPKHRQRWDSGRRGEQLVDRSSLEKSASERFWEKVDKRGGYPDFSDDRVLTSEEDGECWVWTGARRGSDMKNPYGAFRDEGRQNTAHRWAYTSEIGPVPDGMEIDHRCRNRLCVNPAHLEVVTMQENNRRRRKSKCKKGHPLSGDNLRVYRYGSTEHRMCNTCLREKNETKRKNKVD